ncbi:TPA: hypothetical protein ROY08_001386 [Bacillus cereus]|nr:hypothetical protein [Bacillus cereus]
MLPITKVLELSTHHISEVSACLLNTSMISGIIVYHKEKYGWFIYVSSEEEENEQIPDDLNEILKFARSNDCLWIMLDRDYDTINELPTFEW